MIATQYIRTMNHADTNIGPWFTCAGHGGVRFAKAHGRLKLMAARYNAVTPGFCRNGSDCLLPRLLPLNTRMERFIRFALFLFAAFDDDSERRSKQFSPGRRHPRRNGPFQCLQMPAHGTTIQQPFCSVRISSCPSVPTSAVC